MAKNPQPLFTPDWPRYAVAAHLAFWVTSAFFLTSCIGGVSGIVPAGKVLLFLAIWIAASGLLGAAAAVSGRLYIGNQVFARAPTTGWPARLYGAFVCMGSLALIVFAVGLSQVRGI